MKLNELSLEGNSGARAAEKFLQLYHNDMLEPESCKIQIRQDAVIIRNAVDSPQSSLDGPSVQNYVIMRHEVSEQVWQELIKMAQELGQ